MMDSSFRYVVAIIDKPNIVMVQYQHGDQHGGECYNINLAGWIFFSIDLFINKEYQHGKGSIKSTLDS